MSVQKLAIVTFATAMALTAVAMLATPRASADQTEQEYGEVQHWVDSWVPDVMNASTDEEQDAAICAFMSSSSVPGTDAIVYQHAVDTVTGWDDLR